MARLLEEALTAQVIGAFYAVYNELRFGFLENVYARAFELELRSRAVPFTREHSLAVTYKGSCVGHYRADFLVDSKVIVELKACQSISDVDKRQLLHYLRATNVEVGLLLHFGPKAVFHRTVWTREEQSAAIRQDLQVPR